MLDDRMPVLHAGERIGERAMERMGERVGERMGERMVERVGEWDPPACPSAHLACLHLLPSGWPLLALVNTCLWKHST